MKRNSSCILNSCAVIAAALTSCGASGHVGTQNNDPTDDNGEKPKEDIIKDGDMSLSGSGMNVVFILADDLGYGDLGCTGQTKIKTPNIDRLASEGMLFTNHYAGSTVSAPSRSALMTGLHTGHTPIRGNKEMGSGDYSGQAPLPADIYNMAKMFKSAGYVTGAFGKWGLGYPGSAGDPMTQGFDEFFGYNCQAKAHRYYPSFLWGNDDKVVLEGNQNYKQGDFSGDIIHAEALKFIEQNRSNAFFAFLPYTLPHAELTVPEDDIIESYRGQFPETPFKGNDYGTGMSMAGYCSQPIPNATYAAMVTRFDRYVGEVVALLEKLGIADNTLIMFTSDNGPHREGGCDPDFFKSYGPFRGIKRALYEGGIRLPLIAWAPGRIDPGKTSKHICASWDILPTMAEITGHDIPASIALDGISILPTLIGSGSQIEHDYLYWEFHEQNGKTAIRMGKWKAVRNNAWKEGAKTELYDLDNDIHEDNNIAATYPNVVSQLEKLMREARTDSEIFPFPAKW